MKEKGMAERGYDWLDDVIDASQAASILKVTRQHVVLLCTSGKLPARRLTSTWITTRQAVMEYASTRPARGRPRKNEANNR